MSNDGAARKVDRLNEIIAKVKDHGPKGIAICALSVWAERRLGISEKTVRSYLRILERSRELREESGRVIFIASEYV